MVKTDGTYIWVAYKNVFGYISTDSWPFLMIQRPTIREKCAWIRSNTWRDERPVFFGFSIFRQTSQLATEKIQNLCNRNWWSSLLQLGSVRLRSFFQSSELDLRTVVASTLWALVHVVETLLLTMLRACCGCCKWLGMDFGGASETRWWHGDAGCCGGGWERGSAWIVWDMRRVTDAWSAIAEWFSECTKMPEHRLWAQNSTNQGIL